MTEATVPTRNELAVAHTWNAPSVFPTVEDWEVEFKNISDSLSDLGKFQGHLSDGPATLADALEVFEHLIRGIGKVVIYAGLSHYVDTTDQEAAGRFSMAQGLYGKSLAAVAYLDPELLKIGERTLLQWVVEEPRLTIYEHYISNLFRKQVHIRSTEVEELLGLLTDPFSGARSTARMLTDAEFRFEPAVSKDGRQLSLTQGTLEKLLTSADREARRTAWENYADTYLAHKNTLTNNLITSIKQNVFLMHARRHSSTLEAALFEHNIPVEVFHNLIDTFRKNIPTWHRYWEIRRKALGVETLHTYDIWAPLT
ncbi:MAG: hypothetical protein KAT23_04145, partial [Anaerolineales bacterium]|nr:hypothetical protein [Anaerolineales bacterium]